MEKIEIGTATLYCADAFDVLPTLNDGEIDLVASDPPYAAESFGGKCTDCSWDTPINLPDFWQLVERKTKPSANIVLFGNMKLAYDLINTNLRGFRYDLCWAKNNKVGFFNANLQPLRSHENILVFGKPGGMTASTYNAIKSAGSGRPRVNRVKSRKSGGVYPASQVPHTTISDGNVNPISILAFDKDSNQPDWCAHPTQKPLNLLGYLLMLYSNPNNLVLDMFMGSGTTGLAAIKLNRKFIGIEREQKYFDIACRRLEEAQQRKERYKPRISESDDPNELEAAAEQLVCS
jgi:site-specific DNA-methyltransferase (adenine-specific)